MMIVLKTVFKGVSGKEGKGHQELSIKIIPIVARLVSRSFSGG
jgi:hypothetical protein